MDLTWRRSNQQQSIERRKGRRKSDGCLCVVRVTWRYYYTHTRTCICVHIYVCAYLHTYVHAKEETEMNACMQKSIYMIILPFSFFFLRMIKARHAKREKRLIRFLVFPQEIFLAGKMSKLKASAHDRGLSNSKTS